MLKQFNHEWTRMNTDFSGANSNTLKIPKGLNQSAQRWCDGGRAQAPTLGNVPQNNSFSAFIAPESYEGGSDGEKVAGGRMR
jgi:hypothetical protein